MLAVLAAVGPADPAIQRVIRQALGAMLLLTALATLFQVVKGGGLRPAVPVAAGRVPKGGKGAIEADAAIASDATPPRWAAAPWAMGWGIGGMVTLTSVGAGAIGMALLMVIYPRALLSRLVAADVSYAVPVTLAAGLGHATFLGTVDWALLGWLLLGSLPGIWMGAQLVRRVPQRLLRSLLLLLLGGIGVKLLGV